MGREKGGGGGAWKSGAMVASGNNEIRGHESSS